MDRHIHIFTSCLRGEVLINKSGTGACELPWGVMIKLIAMSNDCCMFTVINLKFFIYCSLMMINRGLLLLIIITNDVYL